MIEYLKLMKNINLPNNGYMIINDIFCLHNISDIELNEDNLIEIYNENNLIATIQLQDVNNFYLIKYDKNNNIIS